MTRTIILHLSLVTFAGCAGGGSSRVERYESQCAASGVPPGSHAMANCITEKDKADRTRQASQAAREHMRRMNQVEANSRVYR